MCDDCAIDADCLECLCCCCDSDAGCDCCWDCDASWDWCSGMSCPVWSPFSWFCSVCSDDDSTPESRDAQRDNQELEEIIILEDTLLWDDSFDDGHRRTRTREYRPPKRKPPPKQRARPRSQTLPSEHTQPEEFKNQLRSSEEALSRENFQPETKNRRQRKQWLYLEPARPVHSTLSFVVLFIPRLLH
ncbi:hypothetical protein MSAN_02503700 [Mycena sanguinolenta]|uniref:Uncharacterized protein n=1 Tax=Mycena sanguinolenta TaxID=230812 RepID=A0A8H6U0G7_9AGAR|nr:hypothetical protein MSAN_02503700 [Mycena sanguinolenta]